MQALLKPLLELAEYEDIVKKKKEAPGVLMLTGCVNSQKTHMMYALSDGCCYKVIACSSEAKAKQIYEEYRFLDAAISFYPAKDLLFYQADIRSKELVSQRREFSICSLLSGTVTVAGLVSSINMFCILRTIRFIDKPSETFLMTTSTSTLLIGFWIKNSIPAS